MAVTWSQLELPFVQPAVCSRSAYAVFDACPLCDCEIIAEHAHYRCTTCGWRDSCCD